MCLSRTENADRTAAEIKEKGGWAEGLVLDLADYEVVERTIARRVEVLSLEKWGVVLAAGVLGPAGPLAVCSLARFLTRMYAQFEATAGRPCSDRGSGCSSLPS